MKKPPPFGKGCSDHDIHELITYLRAKTPLSRLNFIEARDVLQELFRLGYTINEPDRHPSGLPTNERAIVTVQRLPGPVV